MFINWIESATILWCRTNNTQTSKTINNHLWWTCRLTTQTDTSLSNKAFRRESVHKCGVW